jgi:glycosyltransferase involved in cell wall biosynthesis
MISACALVPYPLNSAPSQRYRFEQWRPFLQAEGIDMHLFPSADQGLMRVLYEPGQLAAKATALAKAFCSSLVRLKSVRRYDVVLVHRAICIAGPALLERILSFFRRPVVFDFDDSIYRLHTSAANRWFGWLKFPGKTAAICRLSSHITVGNAYLAHYARRHNPNVTIVPSSVDTDRYRPTMRTGQRERPVVGWTGSSTSQTHLEMFAPVLRELASRRHVEIRVLSDREPRLPHVPFSWHRWSPQTEAGEVGQMDIGIMPMPDDDWARGKCAFKALQYMAMGIPAVCSPVGANTEVVQHGVNGMLAASPEEWLIALETLIDDKDLRKRLGAAGRLTVEHKYSMRKSSALLAGVIRKVVHG